LGRVQGGSACWVSRGQSPLGRVQGDNACSGVQRVKPFGLGRMLCYNGQCGRGYQKLFYIFYPAHICLFYALSWGLYLIMN